MRIDDLDLDSRIIEKLRNIKIEKLTPPQEDAIKVGLLNFRNVLVSSPTASGKTLIGLLAILNVITKKHKKGIFVVPLKALANEKYEDFISLFSDMAKIGISTGDFDRKANDLIKYDIIIMTYEKLDSLLRVDPEFFSTVGCIVIDEIHNVGSASRGGALENIIAHLKVLKSDIQLVGLSATIGNPETLAKWLNAKLIESKWRPVDLLEGYYYNGIAHLGKFEIKVSAKDPIKDLVLDTLEQNANVLILVQARRHTESLAKKLAPEVKKFLTNKDIQIIRQAIKNANIQVIPPKLLMHGIGFHHAGLASEDRRLVEFLFRKRAIKVVIATPTLAAGINMPARRVLIRTKRYNPILRRMDDISISEYKQIAGRAGRPAYDPFGEAIILDQKPEDAKRYIKGKPEPITSALTSLRNMRIFVLTHIVSGPLTQEDLENIFKNTLYYQQMNVLSRRLLMRNFTETLELLEKFKMIVRDNRIIRATKLGELTNKLYLDPLTIHNTLKRLNKRAPQNEIEALYLIIDTPDFGLPIFPSRNEESTYREQLKTFPEEFILSDTEIYALGILKTANIILDWINELEEKKIHSKYGIYPGDLFHILDSAEWIAHGFAVITASIGGNYDFRELEKRIAYGVKKELLEICEVPHIGRKRARMLFSLGIESINDLRENIHILAKIPGLGPKRTQEIIDYLNNKARKRDKKTKRATEENISLYAFLS